MQVEVENGSFLDFSQITVRPVEMMRWRGHPQWVPVTLTPTERGERSATFATTRFLHTKTKKNAKQCQEDDGDEGVEEGVDQDWPLIKAYEKKGDEHVFGVAMRKGGTVVRRLLAFSVDPRHLNGPPYALPHSVMVEHQCAFQVKLRRTGIAGGLVTPTVVIGPIVFDSRPPQE